MIAALEEFCSSPPRKTTWDALDTTQSPVNQSSSMAGDWVAGGRCPLPTGTVHRWSRDHTVR